MSEKLLSPEAAAELLDVSPATVRGWLRSGILQGSKVGGGKLWRISESAIDEFIKAGLAARPVTGSNSMVDKP